jgi:hypothetical protein
MGKSLKRRVINKYCECKYHIKNNDMTKLYVDKMCDEHKSFLRKYVSVSPKDFKSKDDYNDWMGLHLAVIDDE